jgi:hypothetical protein
MSAGENEIPARVRKSLRYKLRPLNHETTLFLWKIPEWIGFNSFSFCGAVSKTVNFGHGENINNEGSKR